MSSLSDVFKYISHFRHAGHQVGRKVGDMLEVLTYAAIVRDDNLCSRLQVEPKLVGHSGAGHKVEFTLLNSASYDVDNKPLIKNGGVISDPSKVLAFIECKKVGVEQTVNTTFKKSFKKHDNKSRRVDFDDDVIVSFAPRGAKEKFKYIVSFDGDGYINIAKDADDKFKFKRKLTNGDRIIFTLSDTNISEILDNTQSLRDVAYSLNDCRILEIISVEADYVVALLNNCLPGPQTPEKAKQSAFVALDVRKKRFNSFDKRDNEKELVSVLVLTEFSHWEKKSQSMITSCIDRNLVVGDEIIVKAFMEFEKLFGKDFYDKITKDNFENDEKVRKLAMKIVEAYKGKIFRDLSDSKMKRFAFVDGQLAFCE